MMRRPIRIALVAALALSWAASVQAQEKAAAKPAATRPAAGSIVAEPVPPRVDATFRLWDQDRNGVLSLESRLREQFQAVDTNHSGALEAGEYANLALVRRVGGAAPPLTEFDADQDRKLDFPEYLAVVRRLAPAPQAAGAKPGRTDAPSPSRTSD